MVVRRRNDTVDSRDYDYVDEHDHRVRSHDLRDNDSSWLGSLFTLLMIPLLLLGGLWAYNAWKSDRNNAAYQNENQRTEQPQYGVGGGPSGSYATPTASPTPTLNPGNVSPTRDPNLSQTNDSSGSGAQVGVGGGFNMPDSAPNTGVGAQ